MKPYLTVIEKWNEGLQAKEAHSTAVQMVVPGIEVYPASYLEHEDVRLLMVRDLGLGAKRLLLWGKGALADDLTGELADGYKLCPLSHENRLVINRYFPHTGPTAFGKQVATIGLGDRLGLASAAHIRAIEDKAVKPVLAQQSIRELDLTGRDYSQVLDAACYAVLQEGYRGGFGFDGDHLKQPKDIEMAIETGITMLTLDCSEQIDDGVAELSREELKIRYMQLPEAKRTRYETTYLNTEFTAGPFSISMNDEQLMKFALIYGEAIQMTIDIYEQYVLPLQRELDFELSIDETVAPTEPEAHWFVGYELMLAKVDLYSVAPRFCGEFQKGIDYIGDLEQFERELSVHAAIADHFGYKLSIHSGSDKFSVFPMIAKYTRGRFHVKTAGTNWLEAMRTIARVDPNLYRQMHSHAMKHYKEALSYYHVTTDFAAIRPLDQVSDEDLPEYMNENNARQLIHITYGILLQAKDDQGRSLFRDKFLQTLFAYESSYDEALINHISRHLQLLGK